MTTWKDAAGTRNVPYYSELLKTQGGCKGESVQIVVPQNVAWIIVSKYFFFTSTINMKH